MTSSFDAVMARGSAFRFVITSWRLRRLNVVETGLFDSEMTRDLDERGGSDEGLRLARAFEKLAISNGALGLLTHYETRRDRTYTSSSTASSSSSEKRKNEPDE